MASKEEKQAREVGVVRCTTNRVWNLYDQVKRYSPLLRYGFETVEHRIPDRIAKMGDPLIDGLDGKIDDLKERAQKVKDCATHTVREKANQVKETTNKVIEPVTAVYQALDADHDGKVSLTDVKTSVVAKSSEVVSKTSEKLTDMKTSVTTKTTEVVTKTNEKWKDLRGDMSKKAAERLEKGLGRVCEFSATRGKEIIHIDLIQYSREVIDGASAAVSHKFHDISATVASAVHKANEAKVHLQEAVIQMATHPLQQLDSARANLRLRLKAAIEAARELSASSVSYVHAKYGAAAHTVSHLPEQIVAHMPQPAQKSVDFILSSPQLFERIKNKADVDASKRTLENITNLMSAVKDVILEGAEAPEAEAQPEHLD
jgi:predicted DNA-binding protein